VDGAGLRVMDDVGAQQVVVRKHQWKTERMDGGAQALAYLTQPGNASKNKK